MAHLSDSTLVARCINRDRAAWNIFVERFSPLLFWAIKEKLKHWGHSYNQQNIEDIFQNVFVLLWEKDKLRQITNRESISSWLTMVAANSALNYFRNKREWLIVSEPAQQKLQPSNCRTNEIFDNEKVHDILEELFSLLLPRERIILKLNYLHNKTHQEIGRILKMPTNTVSSIVKRTKEKLKEKLENEGFKIF